MTFNGFQASGVDFLEMLAKHNDRDFFKANKAIYDEQLKAPGLAFVEALREPLRAKISPHLQAEPKVGGSLFRQHRDTRFSKDKRPYKEHFDFFFWEGPPGKSSWVKSGFFMRIQPPTLMLGCGIFQFDKDALARFREAVDDKTSGADLVKIQKALKKKKFSFDGTHYKRVPKGYAKDHPRADLLLHKGLTIGTEMPLPATMYKKAFVGFVVKHFEKMAPLHRWLDTHVVVGN